MGSTAYSETYTYNDSDGSLNTMTTGVGTTLTMGYDGLRRLTSVTGGPFNRSYAYRDISGTATTLQVSQLSYPNLGSGVSFGYTYDNLGNIATYTAPDGEVITYSYDNQGQLLKAEGDATYLYVYDSVGNILSANGHTYSYGNANWKDLLTAFDGNSITYDASGNPTSYYNGTRWTMTWANGRSLATASDGTNSLSFTYDDSGLRTSKTVGSTTYRYYYAGGKLMRMTWGGNTIDFFYDESGLPYAMKHNGTVYYYVTNLQGDVMRVVNASGTVVASYDYDPYGKVLSATGTLANVNPLRYRAYVYDQETGFYYLQSRYYDPVVGRFINADSYASTGQGVIGNNMWVYCNNCPLAYTDESGELPQAVTDKLVHDAVLAVIVFKNPNLSMTDTCVYYNGENIWGGYGFCDLFNTVTGEVWELKKDSWSRSCRTSNALAQLARYTTGKLKYYPKLPLKFPEETQIDDGHFSFTFAGYEYDVSYWSENNGILRYSYNRNATNLRKAIEVVTWLAVGSAFIPVAFASPAFAFALIA